LKEQKYIISFQLSSLLVVLNAPLVPAYL